MRRTQSLALGALTVTALLLAACGSPGGSSTGSTAGSSGGSSSGSSAGSSVPSVAGATDLNVAPKPSAGTPPAPTHLVTKDLVIGTGPQATATSTVKVQYVGASYASGKVFDSSWSRGQAATFPLNQVVPGFAEGIAGMKVGGRREIVVPSKLGYGAQGSPPAVKPNETLVFVVDLLGVQ